MKFYTFNGSNGFNNGDRFAGLRFWLTLLLIVWGLSALGLSWIVNSVFILIGLVIAAPAIALIGFQWWLRRSIVSAECPVCSHVSMASRNGQFQCPSCDEILQVEKDKFVRLTPPGTIDIEVQTIE